MGAVRKLGQHGVFHRHRHGKPARRVLGGPLSNRFGGGIVELIGPLVDEFLVALGHGRLERRGAAGAFGANAGVAVVAAVQQVS